MTLWNYIKDAMLKHPKQTVCENEAEITFEDLVVYAEHFAEKLKGRACCAILCQSEMATAMALLGCFAAEVTALPLCVRYGEKHYQKNLDMVLIAPTAKPPVCKIMDYNKYVFDMAKKERENRKNQKVVNIKEVRLGLGIGEHDFQVKVKGALKFLKDGDKVKVTVRFGGREMNHTGDGEVLIDRFADAVSELGIMEKRPKLEGKRMSVIINPK